MNIGVICSAGGAVFEEILNIYGSRFDFYLITDRECPANSIADKYNIKKIMLLDKNNISLSEKIYDYCTNKSIKIVITYFSRLICDPLINGIDCYNVHPSILPLYPGMKAEEKAFYNKDDSIGATLHKIDSGVDTGPILFQSSIMVNKSKTIYDYENSAFICKLKVTCDFLEYLLKLETN